VTCLRCGGEVSKWVAVLWQHEHGCEDDVEVTAAEALAILCRSCADLVHDLVWVTVNNATR
jgi:hypothetical protein